MTPTERAIQSRIKEAFAFKISSSLWEYIIEALENTDPKSSNVNTNKQRQVPLAQTKGKGSYYNYSYNEYYNTSKDYKL